MTALSVKVNGIDYVPATEKDEADRIATSAFGKAEQYLQLAKLEQRESAELRTALHELAELSLEVLESYRLEEGIEEWDEADHRCQLYNDAWRILGEERAGAVVKSVSV